MTNLEKINRIKLTQGKYALVDAEDCEWLNQWKWCFNCGYARRRTSKKTGKSKIISMHRVILGLGKHTSSTEVDHINRNPLDNRKSNLRVGEHWQNTVNSILKSNNTSGYRGVKWAKVQKKWSAQIGFCGKRISLGNFSNIKDAARAYNGASVKYHGDYSVLNII